jgi:hypothetical protein
MKNLFLAVAVATFSLSAHALDVSGSATAIFDHPTPLNTVYSGTGTNSFNWGTVVTGNNNLSFAGSSFSAASGTPFKLGSFSYSNGTTLHGSNPASLDFTAFMNFNQPTIPAVAATFRLGLNGTANSHSPRASTDFVNFEQSSSSSQFIIDGVTYTVKIAGFGHVVGNGYLSADGKQFHVREGGQASVDLYGEVTPAPVPEPETWSMLLGGLGLISLLAKRRKGAQLH